MATRQTDEDQIRKLVEGDLGWNELQQEVMPDPKDPNRFEVLREILQERVEFEDLVEQGEPEEKLEKFLHVLQLEDDRKVRCIQEEFLGELEVEPQEDLQA